MRRLADREPRVSTHLRHVADQIEGEAHEVAEHADRPPRRLRLPSQSGAGHCRFLLSQRYRVSRLPAAAAVPLQIAINTYFKKPAGGESDGAPHSRMRRRHQARVKQVAGFLSPLPGIRYSLTTNLGVLKGNRW
jgi:hypothetical protein